MKSLSSQKSYRKSSVLNSKGQVLVEYMLLLLISVSFSAILVKKLISRGAEQGIIIQSWDKMLQTLGNDLPDCSKQTDFSSTKCK